MSLSIIIGVVHQFILYCLILAYDSIVEFWFRFLNVPFCMLRVSKEALPLKKGDTKIFIYRSKVIVGVVQLYFQYGSQHKLFSFLVTKLLQICLGLSVCNVWRVKTKRCFCINNLSFLLFCLYYFLVRFLLSFWSLTVYFADTSNCYWKSMKTLSKYFFVSSGNINIFTTSTRQ